MSITKLPVDDAHLLVRRFFEGETTVAEEKALECFLLSSSLRDEDFEEARAVMGIVNTAYAPPSKTIRLHRPSVKTVGLIAAFTLIFALVSLAALHFGVFEGDENICVAYLNGKKVTDTEMIFRLMHQDIECMELNTTDRFIDSQMSEMFADDSE